MPDSKPRSDLQRRVLKDRVEFVYNQGLRSTVGGGLATALLAVGLWGAVPTTPLLIWTVFASSLVILRCFGYIFFWRYFPEHPEQLNFWRNLMVLGVGAYGVVWAVPAIFIFPHDSLPHQVYISFIVIALAVGGSVTFGTLRGSPELFFVPALSPLIVQFFLSEQETGRIIASALTIFGLVMVSISKQIHQTVRRTMELNQQNQELLADLKVSEQKFRGLVENATDSIVLIQDNFIVYANQATAFLSGYTESELLNVPITTFMADSERSQERIYAAYQQRISGKAAPNQYEAQVKRKDGEMLDVLISSSMVQLPKGPGVIAMIKNITHLKEIERVKSKLIAVVSHEIRTPVTAIHSSLEAIWPELKQALPEDVLEIFSVAQKNSNHLSLLVNDILDFDNLDSARTQYRMKLNGVADLVNNAVETNRPLAKSEGIVLNYYPNEDTLEAWCDFYRITQVINNLLSNAIKFSAPRESITIEAARSEGWVRVSVSNHGLGIPSDFRERIFQPFSQANSKGEQRGSGLGLSICKSIMEDHNGSIGYESEPGQVTTFYILLPTKDEAKQELTNTGNLDVETTVRS